MKRYDSEFRNKALRRILEGESIKKIAQDLKVSDSTLYQWIAKYYMGLPIKNNISKNNNKYYSKAETTIIIEGKSLRGVAEINISLLFY